MMEYNKGKLIFFHFFLIFFHGEPEFIYFFGYD